MTPEECVFITFVWLALGAVFAGAFIGVIYGLMRGAEAAAEFATRIGRRLWARKKPCAACAHARFVYGPKIYDDGGDHGA